MQKTAEKYSRKEADRLFERLSLSARMALVRDWEKKLWPERFRDLLNRVNRLVCVEATPDVYAPLAENTRSRGGSGEKGGTGGDAPPAESA